MRDVQQIWRIKTCRARPLGERCFRDLLFHLLGREAASWPTQTFRQKGKASCLARVAIALVVCDFARQLLPHGTTATSKARTVAQGLRARSGRRRRRRSGGGRVRIWSTYSAPPNGDGIPFSPSSANTQQPKNGISSRRFAAGAGLCQQRTANPTNAPLKRSKASTVPLFFIFRK